ncbi:MAG: diphthine--ammonia ligase [Candidatus Nanoarchaeia archaeon]|nr:diphthine--ammonia ligase [Candidatus Nanoarchaeia archaeon]
MCGIIGVFNSKESLKLAKTGLKEIENRGKDNVSYYSKKDFSLGHCLHSVVNKIKQPIINKGVLISNCEIYNWKDLNKKYNLNAKNDSHLLALLLEKKGIDKIKEILEELDGVYAFAYLENNHLVLARDIIGIKPLWYSHTDLFAFASEKKALEKIGIINPVELNPRKIIIYNLEDKKLTQIERDFFKITPELKESKEKITDTLIKLITESVKKRIPEKKFGVLFSGGVDSSVITLILKKLGKKFTCYTAGLDNPNMKEPEDIIYAKKASKYLGVQLKIIKVKEKDVEKYIKKIVPLIEDTNVTKVGVALPFYVACEQAKKDNCKVIFSGLGSEELFAGYERHKKSTNINKECLSGLLKMYERDTYRDDVVTMNNNLELRMPFLDKKLAGYCLRIPEKYKLKENKNKIILREAALKLGLNKEIAERGKKAAQYGSNFHKSLKKLAKNNKFKYISQYLRTFYPKHNLKLGALVSSGKDSIYAMYSMLKQNYDISCMITIKSKNPDSFMFHTPGIEMTKLQSISIGIPLIEQTTLGKKEEELKDLKKALIKAKEDYNIEGIITGALFSNYQRERIEKVADSLNLKIFSPLWHMDQETEMREIINQGFEFIITKVMAEGLNKRWLNKIIKPEDIDKLSLLNKKNGLNIAFEGGEAETLMINGPIFSKKISIEKYHIKEESENVAELVIKEAKLISK